MGGGGGGGGELDGQELRLRSPKWKARSSKVEATLGSKRPTKVNPPLSCPQATTTLQPFMQCFTADPEDEELLS